MATVFAQLSLERDKGARRSFETVPNPIGTDGGGRRETAISSNNRCLSALSLSLSLSLFLSLGLTSLLERRGGGGREGKEDRGKGRKGERRCIIKAIRGSRIRYSTSYITNMIIRGQLAPKGVRLCLGREGGGRGFRVMGQVKRNH